MSPQRRTGDLSRKKETAQGYSPEAVIYVEARGEAERESAAEILSPPQCTKDLLRKRKRPLAIGERPLFMSATTYTPMHFRAQYNRPCVA